MRSDNFIISIAFILFLLTSCRNGPDSNNRQPADEKTATINVQQKEPAPGEQLYSKYCLTCHQPDGNGMKGMFPPLAGNRKIEEPADSLITIVLFGLQGPIEINGEQQNFSQPMPSQDYLSNQQIAEVLTYIRSAWGNKGSPVSADEVDEVRQRGKPGE